MKSGAPVLYPNEYVASRVTGYSEEHSRDLPKHLVDYHAHVISTQPQANMMISTFQGQAMVWLTHLVGAKKVLEIGVYHGFSCMIWSHAVGAEGQVTGLEFDPEYAKQASSVFAEHGMDNIRVVTGDALTTLAQQVPAPAADGGIEGEPYDIIFIDAQKSGYPDYLRTILENSPPSAGEGESKTRRLLRKGGLIIGDNALRWGSVVDGSEEKNPVAYNFSQKYPPGEWERELVKLREFNAEMKDNPRLETWLCPLWDGLAMARLKD
ncbi:S-adenosyl-L-methionine-dependent methyltransferase [Apiospora saccharicola]|uniref:S-adenosyl-L-methionine-dependent methyltransferase n=1 Tax=Apiospora saccharicola TaxID=335842 RepID=A0ABR1VAH3_9PEZI